MPLPLIVSCFSKIHIGFTYLVPAHPGRRDQRPLNGGVRACVCVSVLYSGIKLYPGTRIAGNKTGTRVVVVSTRGNESVPIHLAQCRFSGLAISNVKILIYIFFK